MTGHATLVALTVTLFLVGAGRAQNAAELPVQQVVPLSPENLYRGWLASQVIGRKLASKADHDLGRVRNLLVGRDGQIEALVVEGNGTTESREFMFRVPWQRIDASALPRRIIADVTDGRSPTYGIFPGTPGIPEEPSEFAVSEVIGDNARLQAGQGYGYVSDVVFSSDGNMSAVLVTREARAGGGTFAFGFPKSPIAQWNPGASYYGLPYVTPEQADGAAVSVDLDRFRGDRGRAE
jgi:hypothetical protein